MEKNTYHPIISDAHIPACLKKKLVFGNREQINALRDLEIKITEQEIETQEMLDGTIKEYNVAVEFEGYANVTVWANSKKHAEKLAEDMDIDYDNLEIESYYATEIKK